MTPEERAKRFILDWYYEMPSVTYTEVAAWLTEEHGGDCTQQAHTCMRCMAEDIEKDSACLAEVINKAIADARAAERERCAEIVQTMRETVLDAESKEWLKLDDALDDIRSLGDDPHWAERERLKVVIAEAKWWVTHHQNYLEPDLLAADLKLVAELERKAEGK